MSQLEEKSRYLKNKSLAFIWFIVLETLGLFFHSSNPIYEG